MTLTCPDLSYPLTYPGPVHSPRFTSLPLKWWLKPDNSQEEISTVTSEGSKINRTSDAKQDRKAEVNIQCWVPEFKGGPGGCDPMALTEWICVFPLTSFQQSLLTILVCDADWEIFVSL